MTEGIVLICNMAESCLNIMPLERPGLKASPQGHFRCFIAL